MTLKTARRITIFFAGWALACLWCSFTHAQSPGAQLGQTPAGQYVAIQYGLWQVVGQTPNLYAWPQNTCLVNAGGKLIFPFAVGAPVLIQDSDPTQTEVVVPSTVTNDSGRCSITIAPTHIHNSFVMKSATRGLQEAINAAGSSTAQVLITNDWFNAGGTIAMVLAAQGNSHVAVLDYTDLSCLPSAAAYTWTGSAYAKAACSAGGGLTSFTSGNLSPLFTTSLGGAPLTAPALTFSLSNAAQNGIFAGSCASGTGSPSFRALCAADIPVFIASGASHAAGAVPDPGSSAGTTRFLREDATWAAVVSGINQLTGDATAGPGSGSQALTLATVNGTPGTCTHATVNAKGLATACSALVGADLPNPSSTTLGGIESIAAAAHQWIASISTSGIPALTQPGFSDISGTATPGQLPVFIASGASHAAGAVPDPGVTAGTTKFLREDATWVVPSYGLSGLIGQECTFASTGTQCGGDSNFGHFNATGVFTDTNGITASQGVFNGGSFSQMIDTGIPNDGTTGTTALFMAKINSSGNAIKTTTSDTAIRVYPVVASISSNGTTVCGPGTTGNACLVRSGEASVTFDAAGGTINHFAGASTATGGALMDLGATYSGGTTCVGKLLTSPAANAVGTVALGDCLTLAGGTTPTGTGYTHITAGVQDGAADNTVATKPNVQQQSVVYAVDSGAANTLTVTLAPAPTIVAGSLVVLKVNTTNTGATTLNVNGGGAVAVKKLDGSTALAAGDLVAGQIARFIYDGTNYQLTSPSANNAGGVSLSANNTWTGVQTFNGGNLFLGGINAQTGTSYTLVATDEDKLLTFTNASAIAVTLPQATTAGFTVGAIFFVRCLPGSVGSVTITPTTSTIDGAATLVLTPGQSATIFSDGTNYTTQVGAGGTKPLNFSGTSFTITNPNFNLGNSNMFWSQSNAYNFSSNSTTNAFIALGTTTTKVLSGGSFCWTNNASNVLGNACDTFLARGGANQVNIGSTIGGVNAQLQVGAIASGVSGNTDLTGRLTLASGTATYTLTKTYSSAPNCIAQDVTTPANNASASESTTVITFTGTGTDVIKYICAGRN